MGQAKTINAVLNSITRSRNNIINNDDGKIASESF